MTGSIHKKGKVYYVVFRAINSETGRRKQKWIPVGKTMRAAERKLTELIGDVHNGTFRELKKATFNEFAGLWLDSYAKMKTVKGHAFIQTTLDRYGHLIREVNTEQVRRFENVLGYAEHTDSFSDSKNKSVRRLLEDTDKNETEGLVITLPVKHLEASLNV